MRPLPMQKAGTGERKNWKEKETIPDMKTSRRSERSGWNLFSSEELSLNGLSTHLHSVHGGSSHSAIVSSKV